MYKLLVAGLLVASVFPAQAQTASDCVAPIKPDLPINGAILSAQELDAAADQVTRYSKASRTYQICLDEVITKPEKHSRDEWRAALKAYNATAPSVEEVWDTYQKLSEDWVAAHHATKTKAQK
ncbi:MAG: hypothetical protein Q9M33_00905 [Robiginitomaculum sp.]|nr:hypothetical protein [Robiginitomaculum sp.]MDQ7078864.1 hypothetical protein [Robiginitomaculum sp.]